MPVFRQIWQAAGAGKPAGFAAAARGCRVPGRFCPLSRLPIKAMLTKLGDSQGENTSQGICVKITGPYSVGSRAPAGRKKSAGAGGTRFKDSLSASETESAASPKGAAPVNAMDGLLAIQEVPDATDGRSRGLAHGRDLLDGLEDIRRGFLMGSIPVARLKRIAEQVRRRKSIAIDPELSALLDDIELRALVELAKLGIYL